MDVQLLPRVGQGVTTGGGSVQLERFVSAQSASYPAVVAELRSGLRESHWIWYFFPQAEGLGSCRNSQYYAVKSMGEARAYLAHPVLSARLTDCAALVLTHSERPIESILGFLDGAKSPDGCDFGGSQDALVLRYQSCAVLYGGGDDQAVGGVRMERFKHN